MSEKLTVADLEKEGDIAADYLEALLDIAELGGDIDMDVEGERALVAIVGEDLGQLVGKRGEVLDALQELTRLAVTRETGNRSRLMLDRAPEIGDEAGAVAHDFKRSRVRSRQQNRRRSAEWLDVFRWRTEPPPHVRRNRALAAEIGERAIHNPLIPLWESSI